MEGKWNRQVSNLETCERTVKIPFYQSLPILIDSADLPSGIFVRSTIFGRQIFTLRS